MSRFVKYYSRWIGIAAIAGALSGVASAVFLILLERTTEIREAHSWLLYLLPIGGALVGSLYYSFGRDVEKGNNLLIDQFHDPTAVIPFRMTPLVLLGTLLTHLFGGSAGREGTAVQMGGSIADQLTHVFKFNRDERRTLLMAGMAGGFGSVFGVPFAGTLFGLEVLSVGRLHLWAIVECAVAAFVAHYLTLACGVHHTAYVTPEIAPLTLLNIAIAVGAGSIFGGTARLFALLTESINHRSRQLMGFLPLRAAMGGAVLSILYFALPTLTRYAGLGVPLIVSSQSVPLPLYDWIGKLIMTALTLGTGFKGGEVTPLLFVGATLGNALSQFTPLPVSLLASMGLVAVFAGAANTPFACTVMAMELFGPNIFVFAAIACFASYAVSGHRGIYHAQRNHVRKGKVVAHARDFVRTLFRRPS